MTRFRHIFVFFVQIFLTYMYGRVAYLPETLGNQKQLKR